MRPAKNCNLHTKSLQRLVLQPPSPVLGSSEFVELHSMVFLSRPLLCSNYLGRDF